MSLVIADGIEIPEEELQSEYSRSGGPGGQHVNKTETRVVLRFALAKTTSIPEPDKGRMMLRLATRLTKAGELLVACDKHRVRSDNEREARERLAALLAKAREVPKARVKTRPSRGAKERRLADKRREGGKKQTRRSPQGDD